MTSPAFKAGALALVGLLLAKNARLRKAGELISNDAGGVIIRGGLELLATVEGAVKENAEEVPFEIMREAVRFRSEVNEHVVVY